MAMRSLHPTSALAALVLLLSSPACKHARPVQLQRLTSAQDLQQFRESSKVAVVAFVPSDSSPALDAFADTATAVSSTQQSVRCGFVTDRSLLDSHCITDCDSPIAVLTKRGGSGGGAADEAAVYHGEFAAPLLTQWAHSHATPLVARYTENDPAALQRFRQGWSLDLPQLLVVLDTSQDLTPEVLAALEEAAAANDDLKFFVASKEEGKHLLQEVDVPLGTPAPFFLVQHPPSGTTHLRSGMHLDQLPEFIYEFKEGALAEADAQREAEGEGLRRRKGPAERVEL